MWFLMGAGAILAGLMLSVKGLGAWTKAKSSGEIRLRGTRAEVVRRDSDPDRFRRLAADRLKSAIPGLLVLLGGVAWLGWNFLALASRAA